jgi:hypothetical protein
MPEFGMQPGGYPEHGGGGATAAGKGGGAGQHRREDRYAAYLRQHGVYSERNAKLLREVSELSRQVLLVEAKLTKAQGVKQGAMPSEDETAELA